LVCLNRFEFKSWEGAYAALKQPPSSDKRIRKFATATVSQVIIKFAYLIDQLGH